MEQRDIRPQVILVQMRVDFRSRDTFVAEHFLYGAEVGAAFDEGLEDEIRVTVIATGFEENAPKLSGEPYTEAKNKVEESKPEEPAAAAATPEAPHEAEQPEAVPETRTSVTDDDWDILQKIFNKKR